jgi:hypothetical protein
MEGIKLYKWKKNVNVEAHTMQYMGKMEVEECLMPTKILMRLMMIFVNS